MASVQLPAASQQYGSALPNNMTGQQANEVFAVSPPHPVPFLVSLRLVLVLCADPPP